MKRRRSNRTLLALLVLAAAATLTSCGGDDTTTDASRTASTPQTRTDGAATGGDSAGGSATADLELTMRQVSAKTGAGVPLPTRMSCTKSVPATCTSTVTCPAQDDADTAPCAWLADNGDRLGTLVDDSAGRACTMIYGGPETVEVTGSVDEAPIDVTFSRQDGCAIAAWDEAAPLWTDPDAAT